VKLYLDENLSPRLAERLRARGLDATSAHEVGNVGVDDRTQLRYATQQGRAIVTADVVDFVVLAEAAVAANVAHAGMLLIPATFRRSDFGALADAIEVVARRYPAGMADAVLMLSRRPK
jgi:hypothetical protein